MNKDAHINFSEDILELSLTPNEVREGSFVLFGNINLPLRGFVTSHDVKMYCRQVNLDPAGSVVNFTYDGTGMEVGDEADGSFIAVTNQGEATLPYHITVVSKTPETSMGQITNLYQFTKLARRNWNEAVAFFGSGYFKEIVSREDSNYESLYGVLQGSSSLSHACEEFLIYAGKKSPVVFEPEIKEINLVSALDISQEKISILRDGWGHSSLKISVIGNGLSLERSKVDDDDFLGNRCIINMYINPAKLHAGRNYGLVSLDNEYTHLEIPVCIVHIKELTLNTHGKNKTLVQGLVDCFVDYRLEHIEFNEFMRKAEGYLASITGNKGQNISRDLAKTWLLIEEGKLNEARFLLVHSIRQLDMDNIPESLYCIIKFLEYRSKIEGASWKKVADELNASLIKNPGDWRIACLLVELLKERGSGREIWRTLENSFNHGARSPFVYLEALKYLEDNIGRMTTPSQFIIQILYFASKKNHLSDDIIFQIHYLAGRIKNYNPVVEKILSKCYEIKQDDESLFALINFLMIKNPVQERHFDLYEMAVARQIRITGLYEIYLETAMLCGNKPLHENAVRYLFYQDNLSNEQKGYLYRYIVESREDKSDIYNLFSSSIIDFTVECFSRGDISLDLAVLYRHVLRGVYVTSDNVIRFMKIFSTSHLTFGRENCTSIGICSSTFEGLSIRTMEDKGRFVYFWDDDTVVAAIDSEGKRYVSGDAVRFTQLFTIEDAITVISRLESPVRENLLSYFAARREGFEVTEYNYESVKYLCESMALSSKVKGKLGNYLLKYYAQEEDGEALDDLLQKATAGDYSPVARDELIGIMCMRQMYEKAFSWILTYGTGGVSPYHLTAVCHNLIDTRRSVERIGLVKLTYAVFLQGYYTKRMLVYLADHFVGKCSELWKIHNACKGFLIESQNLNEKLLKRITHTGKYLEESTELLLRFLVNGGHSKPALSYLSVRCVEYYKHNMSLQPELIETIRRFFNSAVILPDEIQLAVLKYMSEQHEIMETDEAMITRMIETFVFGREIFLDFFKTFVKVCPLVAMYQDKTVLEYKSHFGGKAILHYVDATRADGKEPVYVSCELEENYNGTYTKEFTLFFGEKIEYYITEQTAEGERLTDLGSLECTDSSVEYRGSRYGMINAMNTAISLGNVDEANKLYQEYETKIYYTDELFSFQ